MVSGPLLEDGRMAAAELTQLGWAVFSLRRRLCRVGSWSNELLSVARTVVDYGSDGAAPSVSDSAAAAAGAADAADANAAGVPRVGGRAAEARPGAGNSASGDGTNNSSSSVSGGSGTTSTTTPPPPLLQYLPLLLQHGGAPLPPPQLEELRQLLLCRRRLPPLPEAADDSHGSAAGGGGGSGGRAGADQRSLETRTWRDSGVPDAAAELQRANQEDGCDGDPWVSDRAATTLLSAVAACGDVDPEASRVATWLLRQPLMVFLLTRLWADATRSLRGREAAASEAVQGGEGEGLEDDDGFEGAVRREEVEARMVAVVEEMQAAFARAAATSAAADVSTYLARYLRAVGTPPAAVPGASASPHPAMALGVGLGPLGFAPSDHLADPNRLPATSLVAAAVAAAAGGRVASAVPRHPASPQSPHQHRPTAGSITAPTKPEAIGPWAADAAPASAPLLLLLHTHCWPSSRWLEALATAAAARLHSPGFRAQSLGMLLWSLAGLGYSPRAGSLQPWLQRAADLAWDFRPANLVSVLCALSAWGELPGGRPAAALRVAAARLLPYTGPRELQLTASALAQLCELPPPPTTMKTTSTSPPSPARGRVGFVDGRGRRDGRGGGRSGGRGGVSAGSGGGVELFEPIPDSRPGAGGGGSSCGGGGGGVGRTAGGAATVVEVRGVTPYSGLEDEDEEDDQEGEGFAAPTRVQRTPLPKTTTRYRRLEPRVGKLLVQRAVQVSYSYSPRHMARMLRLLALRLGCLESPEDLRALLYGHAVHLEGIAAAGRRGRRGRQRSRSRFQQQRGGAADAAAVATGTPGATEGGRFAAIARAPGDDSTGRVGVLLAGLARQRELRELAAAALDAARAVAAGGDRLSDEAAAALLPGRWWRAYVAALEANT